jgi:hypothetical protein
MAAFSEHEVRCIIAVLQKFWSGILYYPHWKQGRVFHGTAWGHVKRVETLLSDQNWCSSRKERRSCGAGRQWISGD